MGVKYRFSYACDSESDLPSISAQAGMGELAYCIAQDSVWRKYVGGWEVSSSVGPAGPKGDKGDTGNAGTPGTNGTNGVQCYTLAIQAALAATTTDAQTIYFGGLASLAPGTTADLSPIYIPKTGTIKVAQVYCNSGTAGTNETWVLHIRKNNTSDTQIASVSLSTANRLWSNAGLSIAVTQGDRIEIKSVHPTWVTNPANVRFGGSLYLEV